MRKMENNAGAVCRMPRRKPRREGGVLNKRDPAEKVLFAVVFVLFSLYALTYIYAVYWTFISSLKENLEFFGTPFALPKKWLFSNYLTAFSVLRFNNTNFIGMIFNSLWLTFGGILVSMFFSCCTAYLLAKYRFPGSRAIFAGALFVMIIPIMGNLPATYKLVSDLKLVNSPLYLITFAGGFGFNFFILNSYFRNISWSYAESAFIDGCGHFRTFLQIMLPQAIPCIVALAVQSGIGMWGDYMTPILYLDRFPTVASGLYYYQEEIKFASNEPVYFAGVLMSIIPVVLLFVLFQNTVMENTVAGGLKG